MADVLAASVVVSEDSDISEDRVVKRRRLGAVKRKVARVPSSDSEPEVVAVPLRDGAAEVQREEAVEQLVRMGFERQKAASALLRTVGAAAAGSVVDVSAAAELLVFEDSADRPFVGRPQAAVAPPVRATAQNAAERPTRQPPFPKPGQRAPTPLLALSTQAKQAVIQALSGPNGTRWRRVNDSIRRGRIALRENLWDGDADERRLEELSPAYVRLKPYQKTGARWLLALAKEGFGGILADEMGLGKTAQTLTFLDLLPKVVPGTPSGLGKVRPCLIIVPPSLLDTWESEVRKWCPHFQTVRYHASVIKERMALAQRYFDELHGSCQIVFSTQQVLHNKDDRGFFFRRIEFEYLIIDEAHDLKNAQSARFKNINGLRVHRRLLLSGTPVQNSLQQLGNLLSLMLAPPMGVEESHGPAAKAVAAAANELQEVVERGALRTVQVRSAPLILRRRKRDVMSELPLKTGHTVRCTMVKEQHELYDKEMEEARSKASSKTKAANNFVTSLFHRLRRVCNHPLLLQNRLLKADYDLLVDLLRSKRPDFRKVSRQKALDEVTGWSDFDVAMAVQEYSLADHLGSDDVKKRFVLTNMDVCNGAAKVDELLQILHRQRESGGKTLVFSQFTQFLDVIALALHAANFKHVRLDGTVRVEERSALVAEFSDKASGTDVFLLSTKAGGTGLNLTAANAVVLMDLSFNPQDNRQAEDRAHRIGQNQPVAIYYLVCAGTVEEAVLRANLQKMELDYQFGGQRSLLQAKKGKKKSASGEEVGAEEERADDGRGDASVREEDDDEDDDDDEAVDSKQVEKAIEESVLAELESALSRKQV